MKLEYIVIGFESIKKYATVYKKYDDLKAAYDGYKKLISENFERVIIHENKISCDTDTCYIAYDNAIKIYNKE